MNLSRYPSYKFTDVEWLGELPDEWNVKRLKHVAKSFPSNIDKKSVDGESQIRLCNYTDVYYKTEITSDIDFMQATASAEQINKFSLKANDVIITKDSESPDDIGIPAYVPFDLPGVVCGYHLTIIRANRYSNGRFIKHLFNSHYIRAKLETSAQGLTRVGLGQYAIENLTIPVPPIDDQARIIIFLEKETSKLERFISNQEKLIELLKEKRQAIISHAVTKGIDPDVQMKESGVDWIGFIPHQWIHAGLTKFIQPIVDYRGRTPTKVDNGVFLVTARNIKNGKIDYKASEEYVDAESVASLLDRGRPEIGDVLFTTEAPLGQTAQIDKTDIALAQRIVKFRGVQGKLLNSYLMFWFMGTYCQSRLYSIATGSTALGIKSSKFCEVDILIPPIEEQIRIVESINNAIQKVDKLILKTQKSIELSKEHRDALISAAVTGKIDVRDFNLDEAA